MLIELYFIFSIVSISLHYDNSLIWRQLKIIKSRWEIDVSYVGLEKFFFATLDGAFSLVFWLCVFDHSLWLFSSHGFHVLCCLSSISFLVLVFIFKFRFSFSHLLLLVLVFYYFVNLYSLTFFLLPPHDFQRIGNFGGEKGWDSNWSP